MTKELVQDYWNRRPCNTEFASGVEGTMEYYDSIERCRYSMEPEIHSFAQFTRFHGKKVLEVGVGAGTDFLQWVRAGARVYGVDLTTAAIRCVNQRLAVYGLKAEYLEVADCEQLPFDAGVFDLVYSWGVIHHTPDTEKALSEIVRVCRPGGICKVMVYNRHSVCAWRVWLEHALLKGKPWRSIAWCIAHHMESPGTKAYTVSEWRGILKRQPVDIVRLEPILTEYDRIACLGWRGNTLIRRFLGEGRGWFMLAELRKTSDR